MLHLLTDSVTCVSLATLPMYYLNSIPWNFSLFFETYRFLQRRVGWNVRTWKRSDYFTYSKKFCDPSIQLGYRSLADCS